MSSQGQRLPSAMELSLHKIQREKQMAQVILEQRQLSSYGLNSQNVKNRCYILFLFICLFIYIFIYV